MQLVECYRTNDGRLWLDEKQAKEHEDDLIGQELGELFKLFQLVSGNQAIGHSAIFFACRNALADRAKLKSICEAICNV